MEAKQEIARASIIGEIQPYIGPRPSVDLSSELILSWLNDMALNTMEICRALNGIEPGYFRGCYKPFSYDKKPDRCQHKDRCCDISSGAVDQRMRTLEKKGLVHSLKIRWFDGRDPGAAANSIQLDNFRIYYTTRASLSRRLIKDIVTHIGSPDYPINLNPEGMKK